MLTALRNLAPQQLAARVGDMHENLSYEMQDSGDGDIASMLLRGVQKNEIMMMKKKHGCHQHCDDDGATTSISLSQSVLDDIQSFEHSVKSKLKHTHVSYRGSFMRTLHTAPQPAHVDYDYPTITEYGTRLFIAFFPLTEEGAYLQLWHDPASCHNCVSEDDDDEQDKEDNGYAVRDSSSCSTRRIKPSVVVTSIVKGTIVYIPYGKMLIVPSYTIHGGGFKRGISGNLRFHLYIAVGDDDDDVKENTNGYRGEKKRMELLQHPMNKYTERYDRTRELCERFVDSNGMDGLLLGHFFDD